MTLWLWLFLLPAAIGAFTPSRIGCLAVVLPYIVLFSVNSTIAWLGQGGLEGLGPVLGRDDALILVVAMASNGVARDLRAGDP